MADVIDAAQDTEVLHLRAALSAVGTRAADDVDGPEMIDGVPHCVECLEPIPPERLKAVPRVARCRECQEEVEDLAA